MEKIICPEVNADDYFLILLMLTASMLPASTVSISMLAGNTLNSVYLKNLNEISRNLVYWLTGRDEHH